ncbi:MAG: DNA repair protein RadC [Gemmatimonadetes bacterium]|nr:DNA repair protein RadC [Gemmatimonadota bacterium]
MPPLHSRGTVVSPVARDRPALRVSELPEHERPRERFRAHGARSLSLVELLALVVGSGSAGRSALVVAHDVLAEAQGSLRRLAATTPGALSAIAGLGLARGLAVHAALELGRRMSAEGYDEGMRLLTSRDVWNAYAPRVEDLPVEEFHVAALDIHRRFMRDIVITRGILNSSLVHPREVFREAIAERAAAIILVHNHPSGDPTPSSDDVKITRQLIAAGDLIGIPVLDHVIVGKGRYRSLHDSGDVPGGG